MAVDEAHTIALVGVPGSGKSALAKELAKQHEGAVIIDGYAEEASEFMDLAKGFAASWYLDFAISLWRLGKERQAVRDGAKTVITCGTMIESSNYSLVTFISRKDMKAESEEDTEVKRISSAIMAMASLYTDSFKYDSIYYLNGIEAPTEDIELFTELETLVSLSYSAFNLVQYSQDLAVEAETTEEATEKRLEIIEEGGGTDEGDSEGQDDQPTGSDGLTV